METWNDIRHADILAPTEDSASVPMNDFSDVPSLSTNDEVVDMGTDFDFEGFKSSAENSLRTCMSRL